MRVCILGRGKVGTALALHLRQAGCTVQHLRGQPPWRALAKADVYILAIPDAALARTITPLGPLLPGKASVFHCAGARSHEELASLRAWGASIGVMHPLVSFAARQRPPQLAGATLVVQGDPRARRHAKQLGRLLDAHVLTTDAVGPAYHAAAALVANAGVALACSGLDILLALGFPAREATRALAGLLRSVAENTERVGLPRALTGPVVRGDAQTVGGHLKALQALDPSLARTYAGLQELVLACAVRAGLPAADARRVRGAVAQNTPAASSRRRPRASQRQRKT